MEAAAHRDFSAEGWNKNIQVKRNADLRYKGQGYELNLALRGSDIAGLVQAFHREHLRRYGYSHREREIELVTLRLRARLPSSLGRFQVEERAPGKDAGKKGVFQRASLKKNRSYRGPAVITEYSATTYVPSGMRFHIDPAGALVVETGK